MQDLMLITLFASLANAQLIDTWINGTIFGTPRKFLKQLERKWLPPISTLGELLTCPRCLSHWTAVPVLALSCWGWGVRPDVYVWPVMWLATVALSRLTFKLAGGDEPTGEEDPFVRVKPYDVPEDGGGDPTESVGPKPGDGGAGIDEGAEG